MAERDIDGENQYWTRMIALGRDFQLGVLYNYCNDRILTVERMCMKSLILQLSAVRVTRKFELEIDSSRNFVRDVENHCNIFKQMGSLDSHLLVSTWSGLIGNFRGASNYLNERSNLNEVTNTLIVRITSYTESLDYSYLTSTTYEEKEYVFLCLDEARRSKEIPTHVVVDVSNGAEVYCVLVREIDEEFSIRCQIEEDLFLVASQMKRALERNETLPDFSIFLKTNECMTNPVRIKCRLYSDLQSEPVRECSVADAYSHCFNVISEMEKNTEVGWKPIPISVYLCPFRIIANQLGGMKIFVVPCEFRDIDAQVVERCCRLVGDWERINFEVDAVEMAVIQPYRASVRRFRELFAEIRKLFKKTLSMEIEEARKTDDIEIQNVIAIAENHKLFGTSRLENWLCFQSADSELVSMIMDVEGVNFCPSRDVLSEELADSHLSTYSLVLNVPRLVEISNKKSLLSMENHLTVCEKLTEIDYIQEELSWMTYNEELEKILENICQLSDHANRNSQLEKRLQFFITCVDNVDDSACYYSVYRGHQLLDGGLDCLPGPPMGIRVHFTVTASEDVQQNTNIPRSEFDFFSAQWEYDSFFCVALPVYFLVQYRLTHTGDTPKESANDYWMERKMCHNGTTCINFRLSEFSWTDSSVMKLRVATCTAIGQSDFSAVIDSKFAAVVYQL